MKQIDNEVNENIYNIYNNKMLKRRPQYMYIFFSNDHHPYMIKKIEFKELEEYYNLFKERIYTIETKLDKALEYANKIILEHLIEIAMNNDYNYDEELWLICELGWIRYNQKILDGIRYFYDKDEHEVKKFYDYFERIEVKNNE